jgi:hypothetical protein
MILLAFLATFSFVLFFSKIKNKKCHNEKGANVKETIAQH